MSGIAGTTVPSEMKWVAEALETMRHRGGSGTRVVQKQGAALGQVWTSARECLLRSDEEPSVVLDGQIHNWPDLSPGATSPLEAIAQAYRDEGPGFLSHLDGHFALAIVAEDGLLLARDPRGVAPLYYSPNCGICFASEVKALARLGGPAVELPPGHWYHSQRGLHCYATLDRPVEFKAPAEDLARQLRYHLVRAVRKCVSAGAVGAWLSGGLDSSTIAAIAQRQTAELHTFAVGLDGAPDLHYAQVVADFVGSRHHEHRCSPGELLKLLPQVIYHLESFDALLVRSSLVNYLAGKIASDYVSVVLSGEGGDELFAGYSYLKNVPGPKLEEELLDILGRLHNTALQRVDRCSKAHGVVAQVPFLDQDVVAFARRIPVEYKLSAETGMVEKWILRRAMDGLLPPDVLARPKAKFWEGAGVQEILHDHAETVVSDADFRAERQLPDGSALNSKEELLYYRLFREAFGELSSLAFVGRTKGVPTPSQPPGGP